MDLKLIRNLIRLMERGEVSELEIDDSKEGYKLRLKRGGDVPPSSPVVMVPGSSAAPAPAAAAPAGGAGAEAAPAAGGEAAARAAGLIEITSPMVGTFYRASGPDSDPYVGIGDKIEDDSVVCIVEAMKVMNEIRAECAGQVVEVLVENGEPVEFGQPLFLVQPR